jgi:hypothetical protein
VRAERQGGMRHYSLGGGYIRAMAILAMLGHGQDARGPSVCHGNWLWLFTGKSASATS